MLQVNDRILCIKAYEENEDTIGKKGTIIGKEDRTKYAVQFDETIEKGHNSAYFIDGIVGKRGYCWNYDTNMISEYLRKINNIKEIIKI